ncbi:hypothetical protein L7F22_065139 [Adiantum nelumboides]|nr:hypothetical protein [Adiantum nelumboides]
MASSLATTAAGAAASSFNVPSTRHLPRSARTGGDLRMAPLRGHCRAQAAPAAAAGVAPTLTLTPGYSSWRSVPVERWEGEPTVQGIIPYWLAFSLWIRYATLVRLHFQKGKLKLSHAQLESEAYSSAKQLGKPRFREFAEAPKKENLLSYFGDLAGMAFGITLTDNANTGVVKLGDGRVVCFTETIKGSIQINPDTLETLGRFEYEDKIGGLLHTPHPFVNDKEFITLIPDLLNPGYTIVRMEVGSNTRKVIGRVKCRGKSVGWVHSFPVTENYIVVPEISLKYSVVNLLKSDPCPYYKFDWEPHYKSFVHIIDRKTGVEVTNVEVPPFVTFHFINAYEDVDEATGKVRVIADCCEHMNRPTILACMRLDALRENPKDTIPDARVGRLIVPLDGSPTGELVTAVPQEGHGSGLDMCTINPLYMTQKYRYVYACGAHRPAHFPNMLTKVDMVSQTSVKWYEDGGIPSEPFFVPRPGARAEDDGVVLSIVSDNMGGSFVVVLDGPTFTELARAPLPHGLPYGLHGCWVPNRGVNIK